MTSLGSVRQVAIFAELLFYPNVLGVTKWFPVLPPSCGQSHARIAQVEPFFATEAAFRAVLLLFNLLAEFQRAAGLPSYRQPATIRTQVLTCGAILGRSGRRLVLHLSNSWGGLKTRIPLLDSILNWQIPTSPKLQPVLRT